MRKLGKPRMFRRCSLRSGRAKEGTCFLFLKVLPEKLGSTIIIMPQPKCHKRTSVATDDGINYKEPESVPNIVL